MRPSPTATGEDGVMRASEMVRKLAVAVVAVVLAGCGTTRPQVSGSASPAAKAVVVASDGTPAVEVLAQIYAGALRAKKVPVSVAETGDAASVTVLKLQDGSVGVLPVFAGRLLLALEPDTDATTSQQYLSLLAARLKGIATVLPPADISDDLVYCVTKATAATGVVDLGNLAELSAPSVAGPSDLASAADGVPALTGPYHVTLGTVQAIASADERASALRAGSVTVAAFHRTDPQTAEFVVLTDSLGIGVPDPETALVSPSDEAGSVAALTAVQSALKQDDLASLRQKVAAGASASDAAQAWLASKGLG
jgi:osmoprotectant transport system substrate-binding protein